MLKTLNFIGFKVLSGFPVPNEITNCEIGNVESSESRRAKIRSQCSTYIMLFFSDVQLR
jgi:hypothetical protein